MAALKALVIGMGVLIIAGVAVIAVTLINRISPAAGPIASVLLQEPAGTRILGTALAPDRLAVTLGGAGPDHVVLIDTKAGHILGRVDLAAPVGQP